MAEQLLHEKLRQARLSKGITLEEIEEETKIRMRYLEAIEDGDYDRLPGHFYARAFIKHYAEYVGLDSEALLQEHQNELPQSSFVQDQLPLMKPNARETRLPSVWLKNLPSVFLALIVMLILVIIYLFYANNVSPSAEGQKPPNPAGMIIDGQTKPPQPPSPSAVEPTSPAPGSSEPAPPPTGPSLEKTDMAGIDYAYIVKNSGQVEVTIDTSAGDCWLEVREGDENGKVLFSRTLSKGNRLSWSSDKALWVKLGAPGSVKLTVNGLGVETPESGVPRYLFKLSP